ncbi:unnamed protein product [Prorocentrum cordatum]|uniref:Pentacotripeptide-repeat region of PRORP domain-containing protein n=1 Tax=Prorocentrum cordatum TaxID=2364126 RepID=A0ABN9WQQ2_9DINO|nr:unnamed protein product [Polarella glacialis]
MAVGGANVGGGEGRLGRGRRPRRAGLRERRQGPLGRPAVGGRAGPAAGVAGARGAAERQPLQRGAVACVRARQWELALALTEELGQHGLSPDMATVERQMRALGVGGHWREALGLFSQLRRQGRTGKLTYSTALGVCEESGRWESAIRLLHLMDRQQLAMDSVTCQQAVAVCQKAGRWEHAIQLLGLMDQQKVPLDAVTCGRVVAACQQARQAGPALDVLREMQRREIIPGAGVYDSVIVALEQTASEDRGSFVPASPAPGLLSEMRERQLIPSQAAYHAVMRTHEMAREEGPALELLSDMQTVRVSRDTRTYRSLMTVCGKVGNWRRSLSLLDEMRADGLSPNGFIYDATITACACKAKWEHALRLFSEALSRASESKEDPYWFSSTTIRVGWKVEVGAVGAGREDSRRVSAQRRPLLLGTIRVQEEPPVAVGPIPARAHAGVVFHACPAGARHEANGSRGNGCWSLLPFSGSGGPPRVPGLSESDSG